MKDQHKNIIVTGCSRGVGLQITRTLAEHNCTVYGISRTCSDSYKELQDAFPDRVKFLGFDLEESEHIRDKVFREWLTGQTPLHGLVNNAATAYDDLVTNIKLRSVKSMFGVNVFSAMELTKYAIRQMLLHGNAGSIVHISSISVHTGYKGLAMYAASKGAIEAFSKNTAREWGEKGIRSNCIVAGFMDTDMSATLDQEQRNRIYARTALKKPTSLASVASSTAFLLAEESGSITGQNIFVDSGTI